MPDVEAIRARAEAATPGEWFAEEVGDYGAKTVHLVIARSEVGPAYLNAVNFDIDRDTAEFVAHARTDVPDLCDEVERLRARDAEARRLFESRPSDDRIGFDDFAEWNEAWRAWDATG